MTPRTDKLKKKFDGLKKETKTELKKFSYSFVILTLIPVFLILVFALVVTTKFGFITLQTGLLILLAALVLFHFSLPVLASKILITIMAQPKKSGGV